MIQAAYTLLIMAMTLLTSVSGSQNVDPAVKENAIKIANNAITYAQQVIAQGDQGTTQNPSTPVFGNTPPQTASSAPAPTCSLFGETYTDAVGNTVGKVSWVSSNAQTGYLENMTTNTRIPQNLQNDYYISGNLVGSNINSGFLKGLSLQSKTDFAAHFVGDGGETICTTSIQIPKETQYEACAKSQGPIPVEFVNARCGYLLN